MSDTWAGGGEYGGEAVTRARQRLRAFVAARSWAAVPPWSLVLYRREHSRPGLLVPRVIGVVTERESFPLTYGLISRLRHRFWIEGGVDQAEIIPPCHDPLLFDEPAAGVLLRLWENGVPVMARVALSARNLPADGLLLMSDQPAPPHGWPR